MRHAQEAVESSSYDLCMTVQEPSTDAPAGRVHRRAWLWGSLRDLLVSGAVTVGLWLTVTPMSVSRGWQLALAAVCVAAVLVRRRFPVVATSVAAAATLGAWSLGVTADPCVMVGLCLFAVAERRGSRLFPWWVLVSTGVIGIIAALLGGDEAQAGIRAVVLSAIVLSAAWALGTRTRQVRRESVARARADERLRLVREVHDVLSHSLGTIGVQAGIAAHVATLDADELRSALREIETDARSTLDELRDLLRGEREDVENTPGAPFGEVIGGIGRSLGRAGVRASIEVTDAAATLPAGHQQAVRRITQEAVTNVVRHSGASSCSITVDSDGSAATVTVRDDGHGSNGTLREGNGLTGLRERAAMLGGQLSIQDGPNGFTVAAWLPLKGGEAR